MLRRMLPVAICAALLVTGCEKKEEKPAPPVRVIRPTSSTPASMVSISADRPVFISKTPLTVGQYVQYLKGTEQDVPAQWQEIVPGSPEAGRAVVGLTRAEAARCAVWHLRRLPTAEEWTQAAEVVKPRPYPWNADGSPIAPSAEVFLVQGYAPQSPEELKARREKDGLAATILKESVEETQTLAQNVRGQLAAERSRRQLAWQQVKPAFFALLDKERKLAHEQALRAARTKALNAVKTQAAAKAGLAINLKAGNLSAEAADAAVADYARQLAEARAEAQLAREQIQKEYDAAQQTVLELTRAYEQWGALRVDQGLAGVEEMIASAGQPETISLAATAKLRLEAAAQRLKEAAGLSGLPSIETIKQRADAVDKQLAELPEDAAAGEIAQLRDKMAETGEIIAREFLQEKELFTDLEGLVDLRARKEAAEACAKRLKEALLQAAPGGGPAAP